MTQQRPHFWNPQVRNAEPGRGSGRGSHPPGWGTWAAGGLWGCILPECLEVPEPAEPSEQINTPTIFAPLSPTPSHHPFWRTKKSWWGTDGNPSLANKWIWSYVDKNKRVLDWWREFRSIHHSKEECCNNAQVKELAYWQAAAFRLPSTQREKEASWTVPPCLDVLGQKDYLPQKESQGARDYQVVHREEVVVLAMALQRCAIQSRMSPGVLCRAVQEFCNCLAPLLEGSNLPDLKMLDVAKKDPIAPPVFMGGCHQNPE